MTRWVRRVGTGLALLIALAPLAFLLLASLSPGTTFTVSFSHLTLAAYAHILDTSSVTSSILLTVAVSAGAALLTLILSIPAAYAFARVKFRGAGVLMSSLLSAWLLPQVFVAVAFLTVATDIGMYGKPYMMVFFGMLQSVPLSVWVLRSFIAGIPREIDEAALLDGASLPTFFRRVLFPIAAPSIAAVAGYSFLLTWQLYLYPLIYMATSTNQLATVGVSNFVGQWSTNYPEMMAYSLLITAPLVVVFLLVQRYIVSGLTSGSVNV